jgi:dTDP-glucose 4,6-dehydratase
MSKINLLATGSSGFLIGNLIRFILKNSSEYKISSIDNINNVKNINSIYYNGRHNFHISDITQFNLIDRIFEIEKPDVIIHGASINSNDSKELINTNILGTQILIDLALKHNVKKFIYVSTDKVYGSLNNEMEKSYTEYSIINPQDIHTTTKASAELLIKSASITHDLKYNIVRSCNNYGPREPKEKLITHIIANIINNKETTLYNSGKNMREWIHVQDFSSAIKTIIENGVDNEIYNVTSGAEFSTIEVYNEICNIIGKGHDLLKFESNKEIDFRYSTDASKLKNLGWKPEFKFKGVDGGLAHTYNFINNNQWTIK